MSNDLKLNFNKIKQYLVINMAILIVFVTFVTPIFSNASLQ